MITQRLREKGLARNAIARTTILRGAEIFGLGLLFRGQEYLLGLPKSPWTDLLRVDVLNILGLSIMLVGALCWLTAAATPDISGKRGIGWGLFVAAVIAIATPWLWTTHQPSWLPWPLESYINGVHTFAQPQPWLFPIFPWVAFAFVGSAVGFLLFSDFGRKEEVAVIAALGVTGIAASLLSMFFDAAPVHWYSAAIYDYWHTSPQLLPCPHWNFAGTHSRCVCVVPLGDGLSAASARSFNSGIRPCWCTGYTLNLSTGDFPSCRKAGAASGRRPPAW